jgi:hypothetical protein
MTTKHKRFIFFMLTALLLSTISGCTTIYTTKGVLYTAHNIWFERSDEISSLNFQRGIIIPAGTPIRNIAVQDDNTRSYLIFTKKKRIFFTTARENRDFIIHWNEKYHPGRSVFDYKFSMTTDKPFEEYTKGMTLREIDAIRRGEVIPGMGKKAVIITCGPPPENMTFNQEQPQWVYWISKHEKMIVYFDKTDRVLYTRRYR